MIALSIIQITHQIQDKKDMEPWLLQLQLETRQNRYTPMHGVAFDADVLFVAIQLAEPDPDYDPVDIGDDDGSGNVSGALTSRDR